MSTHTGVHYTNTVNLMCFNLHIFTDEFKHVPLLLHPRYSGASSNVRFKLKAMNALAGSRVACRFQARVKLAPPHLDLSPAAAAATPGVSAEAAVAGSTAAARVSPPSSSDPAAATPFDAATGATDAAASKKAATTTTTTTTTSKSGAAAAAEADNTSADDKAADKLAVLKAEKSAAKARARAAKDVMVRRCRLTSG